MRDSIMVNIPDQPEGTYPYRLQVQIPKIQMSANGSQAREQGKVNRLVISKVVPKIWSCVKFAIMEREEAPARHRVEAWEMWKYQSNA